MSTSLNMWEFSEIAFRPGNRIRNACCNDVIKVNSVTTNSRCSVIPTDGMIYL